MSQTKLSIIVPVYNVAPYLNCCLDSILSQTFKDYELILVDDGSTDGSDKICDTYQLKDDRIRVIHQQNKGLSGARNTGIEFATGKYITFVDSDDYVHPLMYEILISVIEKKESDVAVCTSVRTQQDIIFTEQDLVKCDYELVYWNLDKSLRNISLMNFVVWNKIYRRSIVNEIRFEDRAFCEDIGYNTEVLKRIRSSIVFVKYPFYYYRVNREGSSGTKFIIESRMKAYRSLESLLDFVESYCSEQALISVVHFAASFLIVNYSEQKKLLNNKQVAAYIVRYYRHVLSKISFRQRTLKELLFCYVPNFYMKLKYFKKMKIINK